MATEFLPHDARRNQQALDLLCYHDDEEGPHCHARRHDQPDDDCGYATKDGSDEGNDVRHRHHQGEQEGVVETND